MSDVLPIRGLLRHSLPGALVLCVSLLQAQAVNELIHVNQVGYPSGARKVAIVNGQAGSFDVIPVGESLPVLTSEAVFVKDDPISGDMVYHVDFSALTAPGEYFLQQESFGSSYPFRIGDGIYKSVLDATLKMQYYQRCGMQLEAAYAGVYEHPPCHTHDGIIYTNQTQTKEAIGGWHDAGDYGRYASPAAVTIGHLLYAYELYPEAFDDELGIPESANGIPDVLDECRYGLEWLLKMQDPATGGVYHKLAKKNFTGLAVAPEDDTGDMYFAPISPTATGGTAAVLAMGARLFADIDAAFAAECEAAAEAAWGWLVANPDAPNYDNPPDINTGEYGDWSHIDERYWAAAELYRLTEEQTYHDAFESWVLSPRHGFGWQSVSSFGDLAYMLTDESLTDSTTWVRARNHLVGQANTYRTRTGDDAYLVAMLENNYGWGSNGSVAQRGMFLSLAQWLMDDTSYSEAALEHVHYILGRNPLDYSYITAIGSKQVMHPHHRPSVADDVEAPVPGMVAGGPNRSLQDPTAQLFLEGEPPSRCFIDHEGSYSTNEITTYWNSPWTFTLGYFVAMEQRQVARVTDAFIFY